MEQEITAKENNKFYSSVQVEELIREWANYTCTGRGQFWKPIDLDNWIKEKLK